MADYDYDVFYLAEHVNVVGVSPITFTATGTLHFGDELHFDVTPLPEHRITAVQYGVAASHSTVPE
jgi:hypothetical protein